MTTTTLELEEEFSELVPKLSHEENAELGHHKYRACREFNANAVGEIVMTPPMTVTPSVATITSPSPCPQNESA